MNALPVALLTQLGSGLRADQLLTGAADCLAYGYDNAKREGIPQCVVLAESHQDVVTTAGACFEHRVALTARGRGSNTTGASIAAAGGVVISLERMRSIARIAADDRYAVVEPGVLNGDLQQACATHGLFWGPDPTSAGYSTIGGNIACNAGGPRTVKYGSARDNLLALRGVDGRGRSFRCGAAVSKNSTGFDLTRLLAGSEGTLAIITEATLRLSPLAETRRGMRALYDSVAAAAQAVARIMAQSVSPCALEFMDSRAIELVRRQGSALPEAAAALLLIEVDGRSNGIDDACHALQEAASGDGLLEWQQAASAEQLQGLWAARKALSPALRSVAPDKINEDVVVPVSQLPALVEQVQVLARRFDLTIVCFGHAGNGNLHVNLLFDRRVDGQWARAEACLDAVFDAVLALGGTLSGEHGIGLVKRAHLGRALDPVTLDLMRAIKAQFDPAGILNPGKLLP